MDINGTSIHQDWFWRFTGGAKLEVLTNHLLVIRKRIQWVFTCLYAMLYYGFCLPCFFPSRFLLRRTTSMRSHMSPGRRIHCWATTRMSWAWRRPSRSPLQKQWSEFQNNHFGLLVPTLPLFGSDISFQLFWGCPWTQVDTDLDWVWGCQYYPIHMWIDLQGIPVGSVWN